MVRCRNLLLHGLSLLLRRFGAVLWIFVFSAATTLLFSLRLHNQFAGLLDHSLASANLTYGFDLASVGNVFLRLQQNVPGTPFQATAIPVFLLFYFVLTPGVLFCYVSNERARISTLLRQGLLHFWRFVRITLIAAIVFGIIVGPLVALNKVWAGFIEERVLGRPGFILRLLGTLAVFLIASLLRLYFDLVEVYTVQLGLTLRPNGKFDRRTRRAYRPALRALRLHLVRAWGGFLLLALVAVLGYSLLGRAALHTLAQPRVWPLLLFSQLAVLWGIAFRLWQRGAQVTLAQDHPFLAVVDVPARPPFVPSGSAPAYAAPVPPPVPAAVAPAFVAPAVVASAEPAVVPPPAVAPPVVPGDPLPSQHSAVSVPVPVPDAAGTGGAQAIAPPSDLEAEHVIPTPENPPVHPSPDLPAPVRTVYDIDPFTPLPPAPNPLPTEVEEELRDRRNEEPPNE